MNKTLGNAIDTFLSIAPTTIGAGATASSATGAGIDVSEFESAVFVFNNAQPHGTPLGVTITCAVYESDDDSTYESTAVDSDTHNITNTYTNTEINVETSATKKYLRGVATTQFNGGTGPFVEIDCLGILGMAKER